MASVEQKGRPQPFRSDNVAIQDTPIYGGKVTGYICRNAVTMFDRKRYLCLQFRSDFLLK